MGKVCQVPGTINSRETEELMRAVAKELKDGKEKTIAYLVQLQRGNDRDDNEDSKTTGT